MSDPKFKRLANMHFNQHGGRRGTRSATSIVDKMLRASANDQNTIRPGPKGMGMISPSKPNGMATGEHTKNYSHLHQLHEKYNEK